MRHILLILLIFAASAHAQTVKSLGYNTTNAKVVSPAVVFTSPIGFPSGIAAAVVATAGSFGAAIIPSSLVMTQSGVTNGQPRYYSAVYNDGDEQQIELRYLTNGWEFVKYANGNLVATNYKATNTTSDLFAAGWNTNDTAPLPTITRPQRDSIWAATNSAPTNATNAAGWVDIRVGTNNYKLPLYQ